MKEGLSGPGSTNKMWCSVLTGLRNLSIVGGSVRRMVVMMWRIKTFDKMNLSRFIFVSFIKISLL